MITREQHQSEIGSNPTANFPVTPGEGNLIVAMTMSRSGETSGNTSISGSGWTKVVEEDVEIADLNSRRHMSVWYKIAGASEPTAIQVSGDTLRLTIQEYSLDVDGSFVLHDHSVNDNGSTEDETSISTGSTTPSTGPVLKIGILGTRRKNHSAPWITSWTENLGNATNNDSSANGAFMSTAFDGDDDIAGAKESTASIAGSNTGNTGHIAAMLVFDLDIETFNVTGVTKDNEGNVLGECQLYLFKDELGSPRLIDETTSDETTGEYTLEAFDQDEDYFVVAFKDGEPDVFDVSPRTIQPQE